MRMHDEDLADAEDDENEDVNNDVVDDEDIKKQIFF